MAKRDPESSDSFYRRGYQMHAFAKSLTLCGTIAVALRLPSLHSAIDRWRRYATLPFLRRAPDRQMGDGGRTEAAELSPRGVYA